MKVYVVLEFEADHTSEIIGVFATLEDALSVSETHEYRQVEAYTLGDVWDDDTDSIVY